MFIISVFFVIVGVFILSLDKYSIEGMKRYNSRVFIDVLALTVIVFFGAVGMFSIKKIFDYKPGLTVNRKGLVDNSSGLSLGTIYWSEVDRIEQIRFGKQKFVSIYLKDPENFLDNKKILKKILYRINMKMCGTPATISANNLKTNFTELYSVIERFFREYRVEHL